MRVLSDKLDKEVEDVTRDIEAYEACLQRLEGEAPDVVSEADFLKEKLKVLSPKLLLICKSFLYCTFANIFFNAYTEIFGFSMCMKCFFPDCCEN